MLTVNDKEFLRSAQEDFPVTSRPFAALGRRAGMSEAETLAYFKQLKDRKVLRYIAAMFDLGSLGIVSTLVAMRVPKGKLDRTVRLINSFPNITHNYLRDGEYNVWFTLSASSERKLKAVLAEISRKSRVKDILDLRTERVFKSRAVFELNI
jgi:DNA-binding Lrp family transcriptional regulator